MRKLFPLLLLAAIAAGGWHVLQNYEIKLGGITLGPRAGGPSADNEHAPPVERRTDTIRVASFNIQVFGTSKLGKPRVTNILAEVVRRCDVVAIQEVRAKSDDILPRFLEIVNATGRHYDYVIGPRLGRTSSKEQYAFIFDTASIEIDRNALYTVADPDDLLHREPLVGWFRVRGPPTDEAFTFKLIDIHTDPDETKTELDALGDVYRAVRDDGRGEDDVILLGDLNVDDRHLGRLGEVSQIMWVISGVPTNTRGDKHYDNILFSRAATTEFTGRAGVFDLIREFNLTMEEALEVSDHMPVWAEFTIREGGQPGRVATRPSGGVK
jgi:endonuclease/exonuclease/phosphatase family metal-dependent hydrolase